MASQVKNGKAFEWAMALALSDALSVEIIDNKSAQNAAEYSSLISSILRDRFANAAELAVNHLLDIEASNPIVKNPKAIRLSSDSTGQRGDVRDVVIIGENFHELGISCKSNHEAFKHPRISGRLDFIKSWGISTTGCSAEYWEVIRPLFEALTKIRKDSSKTALWQDVVNYESNYYYPVLDAFQKELWKHTSKDSPQCQEATAALVKYIIGNNDFYKVISTKDQVIVQGFNLNGTLNVPKTHIPSFVIAVDSLDGGQFSRTVRLHRGMTFNFRVHSASSRVEPSLKFDVQAVSLPASEVYTNHLKY